MKGRTRGEYANLLTGEQNSGGETVKDSTREAILKEIVSLVHKYPPIADDEVTVEAVAEEMGIESEQAYHLLKRAVEKGALTVHKVVDDGHMRCAFRKVATSAESGTIKASSGKEA